MTAHTRFTGFRATHVNSHEPRTVRSDRPRQPKTQLPKGVRACDICERAATWWDTECAYCEYHSPIPPTPQERQKIEAAPFWVTGAPARRSSAVSCEVVEGKP